MENQIRSVMKSVRVQSAVDQLEEHIAKMNLSAQEVLAVSALLAARQISVLGTEAELSGGDMVGSMVSIGLAL